MNSEKRPSAFVKVKGFTLIELLIVIAIIAILSGISSVFIQGLVRDARLETANNKAQQVYAAVQNMLIEFEINQDYSPIDADVLDGGSASTTADYVNLSFEIKDGVMKGDDVTVQNVNKSKSYTYSSSCVFPSASSPANDEERAFQKLAKYLSDNLADNFTGYAYVGIDMTNWVVDTVMFSENVDSLKGNEADFADVYGKSITLGTGSASVVDVYGCGDTFEQKSWYKGDDGKTNAAGVVVGYYPMINDVDENHTTYI
ncbi:MAG: prepilin-type N-terminal cleavage/methylation domain-containing protein [Oscillospiraceae bacterium]|nr:prepilin-type N-terminal cleavage/methylation domain-containing protein [Oscillospiraceae bacterium]